MPLLNCKPGGKTKPNIYPEPKFYAKIVFRVPSIGYNKCGMENENFVEKACMSTGNQSVTIPESKTEATPPAATRNTKPTRPRRLRYVDILITLSCIAVVAMHVCAEVFDPHPTPQWRQTVLIQALCIFAVPIYFMVSGINNLGYREKYSPKTFFWRRLRRAGGALVFASICCYLLYSFFPHYFWGAEAYADSFSLKDFIKRFLTNQVNDIYWFLYSLIYLYLFTPILSLVVKHKRLTEYVLALTFFSTFILPMGKHFGVNQVYFEYLFSWSAFSSQPLFYFLSGYYLHHHLKLRIRPRWLIIGCSLGMVAIICFSYQWLLKANHYGNLPAGQSYDNYGATIHAPHIAAYTVLIVLLAKALEPYLQKIPARTYRAINKLAGCTLGIYLFHLPVYFSETSAQLFAHLPFLNNSLGKTLFVWACTALLVFVFKEVRTTIRKHFTAPLLTKCHHRLFK